ncbi:uncharacterized protein LOC111615208 [Centruroides sculpturatus]|uniref:uncharacterized protein LOC111612960 n=1 Tax=Centruroides sculpturatus TaxID=218467 RepID=UPI000C6D8571|nr:uncharacterized protein LOC111612960 [Centruroides sculpturatus]XP_023212386.1 uncharacterized protein LOC111615208 [Centruroides sculpturatus]XP_023212387.1 uncharacterized protein LOC111615208 [Centruroides sculpturatus]XP_023212388.1 uncharacterized protein LOC111615208 [Centruroides sculpturatus]
MSKLKENQRAALERFVCRNPAENGKSAKDDDRGREDNAKSVFRSYPGLRNLKSSSTSEDPLFQRRVFRRKLEKSEMQDPTRPSTDLPESSNNLSLGGISETGRPAVVFLTDENNINRRLLSAERDKAGGFEISLVDEMFDKDVGLFREDRRKNEWLLDRNVFGTNEKKMYLSFPSHVYREYIYPISQRRRTNRSNSAELIALGAENLTELRTIYGLIIKFVYRFYLNPTAWKIESDWLLYAPSIVNLIDGIIKENVRRPPPLPFLPSSCNSETKEKRKYSSESNLRSGKRQKRNTDLQLFPKVTKSIPSSGYGEDIGCDKDTTDGSIYSLCKQEESELLKEAADNVEILENKYRTSDFRHLRDQLVPDKLTLKYPEETEITMYERQADFSPDDKVEAEKASKSHHCLLSFRSRRPIRVGLSRRQKVKPLHSYLHLPSESGHF